MSGKPTIAILGGTGHEGTGLALRWASNGYDVIIGSRNEEKALTVTREMNEILGGEMIRGMENGAAAREADINVLTVVATAHEAALEGLKDDLQGKILVDGIDVREMKQESLREKIGYVPQKSVLFSGTIGSNLRYADEDASDGKLEEAATVAQAIDFIKEKAEDFDSNISQGGKNVSGGQSQRLSIARALVKDPEILVLDDCFSALDFRTDRALRKALKEYAAETTLFIVAQRVGTVMNAEQIIVLDEGRIAGKGTHSQLMESCETYREIALSQLSMEELA